jgi:hypothetical protein
MTYTEEDAAEGVNGEYYYHYDNFGNTALLTDTSGNRQYAALSNACNGKTVSVWNPNSLEIVNQAQGINGTVSLNITSDLSIVVASSKGSLVTTNYHAILAGVNTTRTFCYWWEGPGGVGTEEPSPCEESEECKEITKNLKKVLQETKAWKESKDLFNNNPDHIIWIPGDLTWNENEGGGGYWTHTVKPSDWTQIFQSLFGKGTQRYMDAMNGWYDQNIADRNKRRVDICIEVSTHGCTNIPPGACDNMPY